jgi:beta-lactam-binding protein with PASTA domain
MLRLKVASLMIASLLAAVLASCSPATPRTAVVPDVVGMSFGRAWAVLYQRGICVHDLTTKIDGRTSNPHVVVRVIRQTPRAGVRVAIPGSVSLTDESPLEIGTTTTVTGPLVTTRGKSSINCPLPIVKLRR